MGRMGGGSCSRRIGAMQIWLLIGLYRIPRRIARVFGSRCVSKEERDLFWGVLDCMTVKLHCVDGYSWALSVSPQVRRGRWAAEPDCTTTQLQIVPQSEVPLGVVLYLPI